ncbi:MULTISPECIES: GtrA family protein [unclassified Arthrobacter]|uniref:GtrA family protein n=1 Tax=unclassified Arthrobacter TaxID=235627 RepID=UPI001E58E63D|nr:MULTISPECIES: GtrA family protein [unclassified Arthrobacter]MCC9144567.1 GtrA family protein [Arthrobacter sp. zg-Y919]MDK1275793.1 GtrA family protein [Arthrobacter sp. zg.Y919]MDM7991424.1 GtrA family protein [Arthrobacter sp. zg-Y877]WIB02843.1 GtrA family protein [Arthrobacter sp. zg-Y919]
MAETSRMHRVVSRLGSFSAVGAVAFVVDVGLFNLLSATLIQDSPILAKTVSVLAATTVSWLGSRYLTFRKLRTRSIRSESLLFALTNLVGLLISTGCLYISHYVLGFDSHFADNVSGNIVGIALGNIFRYFAYRYVVFNGPSSRAEQPEEEPESARAA